MGFAKKSLGQNFLKNAKVLEKIARSLEVKKTDTIIEVGPGRGELTKHILAAQPKKIIVIEKDHRLISGLAEIESLEIIEGDALADVERVAKKIRGEFKIAGNIPYYITGHLLRIISELEKKPSRAVFVVQKEVAERAAAKLGEMNRLAASLQFWAEPKISGVIPAGNFEPAPKVDSAILELKTKTSTGDPGAYYPAMRAIFQQPRKTVLNNLAHSPLFKSKEAVLQALNTAKVDPKSRPQDLSIEEIQEIGELADSGD